MTWPSLRPGTDAAYPKVRLPPNVTIWFWCLHGEALDDTVGAYIESHADLNELPEQMMQRIRDGGNGSAIPEIVKGGSEIWNYRLTYPSGLTLGNKPNKVASSIYNHPVAPSKPASMPVDVVGDQRYLIVPPLSGDIKERGVPIIALLAGNWNKCDGAVIHWCACRSIAAR